jgi:hypothetical protein
LAGFRENRFAAQTMKQLLPQLFLKVQDLLAQRRLRDKRPSRGLCKIACLSDCQEVT